MSIPLVSERNSETTAGQGYSTEQRDISGKREDNSRGNSGVTSSVIGDNRNNSGKKEDNSAYNSAVTISVRRDDENSSGVR
jgi:hypothetical protein